VCKQPVIDWAAPRNARTVPVPECDNYSVRLFVGVLSVFSWRRNETTPARNRGRSTLTQTIIGTFKGTVEAKYGGTAFGWTG
jgi:hypothetical protein